MGPESLRKPAGQATLAQGSTSGTSTPAVKRKRERQIAELNGSVTPSATAQSRISAAQEREEDRLPRNLDLDNSGDDSGTDGEEGAEDQSVTLKESEDDEDVHHFPEIDIGGSESEAEEQIGGNHPDEDDDGFDSEDIDNLEDSDLGEGE